MQCRVVNIVESGLHVELLPGNIAAFLPKLHLSDHRSMCDALILAYRTDDVIDRVMYLGKSGGVVSLISMLLIVTYYFLLVTCSFLQFELELMSYI